MRGAGRRTGEEAELRLVEEAQNALSLVLLLSMHVRAHIRSLYAAENNVLIRGEEWESGFINKEKATEFIHLIIIIFSRPNQPTFLAKY